MGKKQPEAPDPWETAQAQGQMNKETAISQFGLNAYTQDNPWGSVDWQQTGTWEDGTPKFTQTTSLSPEQQAIFNQSQQAEQNLAGLASEQSAKLKDYLNSPFEYTNRDAETWAYDLASPRILEQQRQNQAALQTQLRNQGLAPGSAAWNAEMNRLTQGNTDQLNQLALTGRQQGFAEALAQRNQPINEITALLSGSQVSNPAQMSAPGPQTGVAGVDYTGLVNNKYQADVQAYNSQMNALGGLFGLGGRIIAMSDRRSKRDIKKVGELENGLGWYEFNYKTDDKDAPIRHGVMSDEVRLVMPDAVIVGDDGFDRVDYSKVFS